MNAVYFDLESTGLDPAKDRIIQIALVHHELGNWESLVNPERNIPAEITELTGITNEMVAKAPTFREIAQQVAEDMDHPVIAGFNCNTFDIPLLAEEFIRAGIDFDWQSKNIVDAGTLFKIKEERTLSAAVQFYLKQEHVGAHGALADALATRRVLHAQLVRYAEVGKLKPDELDLLTRYGKKLADPAGKLAFNEAGQLCFNTFRNRGVPVKDEPGYADWIIYKTDFPEATKRLLRDELHLPEPEIPDGQGSLFEHADLEELPFV